MQGSAMFLFLHFRRYLLIWIIFGKVVMKGVPANKFLFFVFPTQPYREFACNNENEKRNTREEIKYNMKNGAAARATRSRRRLRAPPYASSARTVTNHVHGRPYNTYLRIYTYIYIIYVLLLPLLYTSGRRVASVRKARGKLDVAGGEDSRLVYTYT